MLLNELCSDRGEVHSGHHTHTNTPVCASAAYNICISSPLPHHKCVRFIGFIGGNRIFLLILLQLRDSEISLKRNFLLKSIRHEDNCLCSSCFPSTIGQLFPCIHQVTGTEKLSGVQSNSQCQILIVLSCIDRALFSINSSVQDQL